MPLVVPSLSTGARPLFRTNKFTSTAVQRLLKQHIGSDLTSADYCSSLSLRNYYWTRMASSTKLDKSLKAMQSIYGPFTTLHESKTSSWTPPLMAEGHKGRYLWTDGFAVVNFLTFYTETKDKRYLDYAKRLVKTVHDVLGHTRDGKSRLPGATDDHPLSGGLRIGKIDEAGSDGDGQYFHYLTVWMFALSRMTLITLDDWYNEQAVSLARVVLPRFMRNMDSDRPRMFWKMSMDLSRPLVMSEGNLDPIDGYVTYKLLQAASGNATVLDQEIKALKKIVNTKWQHYSSTDPLDLGMTLWTAHWLRRDEEWASVLCHRAVSCLKRLVSSGYFQRATGRRLAFREFGTALGVQSVNVQDDPELMSLSDVICAAWEDARLVPEPSPQQQGRMAELMPITAVMYATALTPGVMMQSRE